MTSKAERAVRAKVAKEYVTAYAYRNSCEIPTRAEIEQYVEDEMTRAKVFAISEEFEQDIWSLVYDERLVGASGDDKRRLLKLCDEWKIPAGSIACREKVKVLRCTENFFQKRAILTNTTLDQVLQCSPDASRAPRTTQSR
jgi:hypothetical protein